MELFKTNFIYPIKFMAVAMMQETYFFNFASCELLSCRPNVPTGIGHCTKDLAPDPVREKIRLCSDG